MASYYARNYFLQHIDDSLAVRLYARALAGIARIVSLQLYLCQCVTRMCERSRPS